MVKIFVNGVSDQYHGMTFEVDVVVLNFKILHGQHFGNCKTFSSLVGVLDVEYNCKLQSATSTCDLDLTFDPL